MTSSVLEDQRTVWVILAVSFVLFFIGNLPWQLDDYDQAKQAFTSFQMVNEGRWLYQQTPHQHVATKPPLVGWISAALFMVTRSWDAAWRLPSLVAAVALALLLFRSAESAYGLTAGLISLGAFGLNLLTPRLATLVRTDMPLALVIFSIGLLIWKKIRDETNWRRRDRFYLFALLTIAILIKGPIVYAFVLPGIGVFEWWRRRRRAAVAAGGLSAAALAKADDLGRPHNAGALQSAWPGWWPWLASLALFLLWVNGGILLQPSFYDEVVMREFIARFGETIHRPQPLYFYLPHLLHKFAPWSLLLLVIAFADLYSRNWRLRLAFREMSPEVFWLLCWSLGGLIVMSLIPSKRVDRIFPVIPPLCLLLAAQIAKRNSCSHGSVSRLSQSVDFDSTGHRPVATENAATRFYRCSAAALLIAILFTGGYTISKVVCGYRHHRDALAVFGKKVRRDANAHHWHYQAVSAKDESLLLYLQKTRFIEPDDAVAEWNRGNLDALVASTQKAPDLMRELRDAALSDLKSTAKKEEQEKGYVLITH